MAEYIERKALREAFENSDADVVEEYEDGTCDWGFGRQNIVEVINSVPAADVAQVRHGRWETISDQEYVVKDFSCSECEELICDFDTTVLWPGKNCYYYCPNCGARMDGDDYGKTADDRAV